MATSVGPLEDGLRRLGTRTEMGGIDPDIVRKVQAAGGWIIAALPDPKSQKRPQKPETDVLHQKQLGSPDALIEKQR